MAETNKVVPLRAPATKKKAKLKTTPKTAKPKAVKKAVKKTAAKKKIVKKATKSAVKPAVKKAAPKKTAVKKATVKKAAVKKTASPAKKKTIAKKATVKPAAKKTSVKAAPKKVVKKSATKKSVKKAAPKQAAKAVKKVTAKTTARKAIKKAPIRKAKIAKAQPKAKAAAKPTARTANTIQLFQPFNPQTMKTENIMTQGPAQFDQFAKEAANINREGIDAFVKSGTIFAKGFEALIRETMTFAQSTAEKQMQLAKDAMTSKTINEFSDAQNKIAKTSFDDLMSGTTKLTEMGVKLVSEAAEPINEQITKSVQKATQAAAAE